MNADDRSQNLPLDRPEDRRAAQSENRLPAKWEDGKKSIGTRKPESYVKHSDNNARSDSVDSDNEEPLYLPKKRRLPPKKSLKSMFSIGRETGSDDSGDWPLSSSSTETIKRKASPSIPSAHLATPPDSEYPSKRHISDGTSVHDKENSVNNAINADDNDALDKLLLLDPTVVEDNRQSILKEQPKQPPTLPQKESLPQTNPESPTQTETNVASTARTSISAAIITSIRSSHVVNEESSRTRYASTASRDVGTKSNKLPLGLSEGSSSSASGKGHTQDTKSYDSLAELISRNPQKRTASHPSWKASRTNEEKSTHHEPYSKPYSRGIPPTEPNNDRRNRSGPRKDSSRPAPGRGLARSGSNHGPAGTVYPSHSVPAPPAPPFHTASPTTTRPSLQTQVQDKSMLWHGKVRWGNYTLQDVNLKAFDYTAVVEEIRAITSHRPELSITSYFSQQHLADYIRSPPQIFALSFPVDSVPYGKLRNLLSINNVAGLVSISLQYSFAVVPYTFPLVTNGDIDGSFKTSLFFVHIALPKIYPEIPSYPANLRNGQGFDMSSVFEWHIVMRKYALPSQILTIPTDKSMLIVDDRFEASKVMYAVQNAGYQITNNPMDRTLHTVLIHCRNFPNGTIPQLEDMKRPGVQFLLFGYHDLLMTTMSSTVVYPERSGGYVTISAEELVDKPVLLKGMIRDVDELNNYMESTIAPKWQIVFPDDIFDQMTIAAGEDRHRGDKAKWRLMKALEADSVSILSRVLKARDTTNNWMDRVAQAFASKRRYFVQVTSARLDNASHRVSIVDPRDLQDRYKPMISLGSIS
ncbi:unnamed protein product [Umbelopsis ramanniana]